jgi:hypothetical protein
MLKQIEGCGAAPQLSRKERDSQTDKNSAENAITAKYISHPQIANPAFNKPTK